MTAPSVIEFFEPALALANAGYTDAIDRLWAAFAVDDAWVAALSAEDRASFLNFPDSIAETMLGDPEADVPTEIDIQPYTNPDVIIHRSIGLAELFDVSMQEIFDERHQS